MSDPRFYDLPNRPRTIGATSVRVMPESAPAADPNDPAVLDLLLQQIIEGGISGVTLPGDAYNKGVTQDEMERRALDTVGLVGVSSPLGVPRGALGSGPVRRAPPPEGSYVMEESRQMMGEPRVPVQQPYSVLSEELGNTQRKSGTIGEFAAELGNKPGVKPEELEFVFGGKDPNQKVTIDEVVKMLEGTPEIKTTTRDISHGEISDAFWGSDVYNDKVYLDAPSQFNYNDAVDLNINKMIDTYNENMGTDFDTLDQLPLIEIRRIESRAEEMVDEQAKYVKDAADHSHLYDDAGSGDYRLPHPDMAEGSHGRYEEVLISVPAAKGSFKGGHWDEPNVILHQRRDVRPIEGKDSLHIDELQSDLHQKGRKEGYTKVNLSPAELEERQKLWWSIADELNSGKVDGFENRRLTVELLDGRTKVEDLPPMYQPTAREFLDLKKKMDLESGPPDSIPFKKSWAKLGITRAITDAVEKGLDRVSWSGGAIQNGRWGNDLDDRAFVGFYDEMLPATVKKNFKKYGVEVKRTNIDDGGGLLEKTPEYHEHMQNFEETNPILKRLEVLRQQFAKASNADPNPASQKGPDVQEIMKEMDNLLSDALDARRAATREFIEKNKDKSLAYGYYFDITPELKKAVQEKGLPLFNKGLPVQGPPKNGDEYLDRILKGDII